MVTVVGVFPQVRPNNAWAGKASPLGRSTHPHCVLAGTGASRSAGLVLAALLVSACTSQTDEPRQPSTTPTSATTATTTPPTAEELASDAATAVFTDLVNVRDAAGQDPGAKDWEPEIRQYAGDPYAFLAVQSIRTYATSKINQVGVSKVTPEVSAVDLAAPEGPTVSLRVCYDSSDSDLVSTETGQSILPPDELTRYIWNVQVTQYPSEPGAPWLVSVLDPLTDQPC